MIAGADGYKGQWIVVMENSDGSTTIQLAPTLSDLCADPSLELLIADVPIGLMERGSRTCDALARKLIGVRRNSVFTPPLRPALGASTWEEACEIRTRIDGKRYSRQTFGILPLIRAVDRLMTPKLQDRVREGHPEVSFTVMAGAPMKHYKGTAEGKEERMQALAQEFPDFRQRLDAFGARSAVTDIIDAYALLWTARRVRAGTARILPDEPEHDARGLRAEIVA